MQEALDAFSRGEFLVIMDDESRENEGDLIIAADKITTEKMAWFIKHTRYAHAAVCKASIDCPDVADTFAFRFRKNDWTSWTFQ